MAWGLLITAGLCEVVMALSLKQSHGFSQFWPGIIFLISGGLSFLLLALALKTLPIGTAYAVWTGIGAAGTAVAGMIFLGESFSVLKLLMLILIIGGVAGLQFIGGGH